MLPKQQEILPFSLPDCFGNRKNHGNVWAMEPCTHYIGIHSTGSVPFRNVERQNPSADYGAALSVHSKYNSSMVSVTKSKEPVSLLGLFAILCLIGFAAVSVDTLMPALPSIARDYDVAEQAAQLVLSAFVFGAAIGTLICGILSDLHGRRHPVLVGIALYLVATIGCVQSGSLNELAAWRFVQGIGASAGPTLAAAIISDIYGRSMAASMLSRLAGFMALLPATMPLVGSAVIVVHHWNGIFYVLGLFALVVGGIFHLTIPETHFDRVRMSGISEYMAAHTDALRHRPFLLYCLAGSFSFAGIFAYISANSFIIINTLGVSQAHYGFTFAVLPLGFFAGSQIGASLVRWMDLDKVIFIGSLIVLLTSMTSMTFAVMDMLSLPIVLIPAFFLTVGVGLVLSNSQVGAMKSRPLNMATASGITGCIRLLIAAVAGWLALDGFNGNALTMVSVILGCSVVSFIISLAILHDHRRVATA